MAAKGHSDLKNPTEARTRASKFHRRYGIGSERATAGEIEIAVADATCQHNIDYAENRGRLEARYFTAALRYYEEEVTAVQELNEEALQRARAVLSDG